jgi:hypothetical protein
MAKLYIAEYATISALPTHTGQIPLDPPLNEQVLDFTAGSAVMSAPFQQYTRMLRLHCDAICSLIVGPNPQTATNQNARFAANQTEFRGVVEGRGFVVSVITNV